MFYLFTLLIYSLIIATTSTRTSPPIPIPRLADADPNGVGSQSPCTQDILDKMKLVTLAKLTGSMESVPSLLIEVIEHCPNHVPAYMSLAESQVRQAEYNPAFKTYLRAIEVNSTWALQLHVTRRLESLQTKLNQHSQALEKEQYIRADLTPLLAGKNTSTSKSSSLELNWYWQTPFWSQPNFDYKSYISRQNLSLLTPNLSNHHKSSGDILSTNPIFSTLRSRLFDRISTAGQAMLAHHRSSYSNEKFSRVKKGGNIDVNWVGSEFIWDQANTFYPPKTGGDNLNTNNPNNLNSPGDPASEAYIALLFLQSSPDEQEDLVFADPRAGATSTVDSRTNAYTDRIGLTGGRPHRIYSDSGLFLLFPASLELSILPIPTSRVYLKISLFLTINPNNPDNPSNSDNPGDKSYLKYLWGTPIATRVIPNSPDNPDNPNSPDSPDSPERTHGYGVEGILDITLIALRTLITLITLIGGIDNELLKTAFLICAKHTSSVTILTLVTLVALITHLYSFL